MDKICSKKKIVQLLKNLFGDIDKTLRQIAPEGWENSPYIRFFHPTAEQQYEEALRMHEQISKLSRKNKDDDCPKREAFEDHDEPVYPEGELLDVLGKVIWEITSENHKVIDTSGCVYDLGSFRGSSGFIADFLDMHYPSDQRSFNYMDFYCGMGWIERHADTFPFYQLIFERLKEQGCEWKYHFPELFIVSPDELRESFGIGEQHDPATYDPGKALQEESEKERRRKEIEKTRERLKKEREEAMERAKSEPLPKIVQAYKGVYGKLPIGYPQ